MQSKDTRLSVPWRSSQTHVSNIDVLKVEVPVNVKYVERLLAMVKWCILKRHSSCLLQGTRWRQQTYHTSTWVLVYLRNFPEALVFAHGSGANQLDLADVRRAGSVKTIEQGSEEAARRVASYNRTEKYWRALSGFVLIYFHQEEKPQICSNQMRKFTNS